MELFPVLPEDFTTVGEEDLVALIEAHAARIEEIAGAPQDFIAQGFKMSELLDGSKQAVEDINEMRAALAALQAEVDEPSADEAAAELAALAALAKSEAEPEPEDEPEDPEDEPEPEAAAAEEVETVEVEPVTAATAPVKPGRLPVPAADRQPRQMQRSTTARPIVLTASSGAQGVPLGTEFGSDLEIADAMIRSRRLFGDTIPPNVSGDLHIIAHADWSDQYPEDRRLAKDELLNKARIDAVIDPKAISAEMNRRKAGIREGSLVASGGLCAPVTPYYNLQYISVADRPVQAALPSFNADRGGLRYARPAALSAVTTAVGLITAAEDGEGGTFATKSCQVIPCPSFQETDVDIIYHCLQFGNLGARAFPELVAQWNNLVLAAHARTAESNLLTGIDAFATAVTAGGLGLGASADLFSQILAARNGLISRNRMDPNTVMRLLAPFWMVDLIVSDVIRGQFQRFDTDEAKVTALLRSFNIEPTFYLDGANGKGQVFGTQSAGSLNSFPHTITWYLYPEGSFLFLDGGMLELGIVRDSVLNKTNDFQIFGETFENVAFVGVEALGVTSTTCDSGTVSLPASVTCPISY